MALPNIVNAQYEDIRNPLTPEEIALYKKNKVMAELQKIVDNGTPKNYKARAIDTSGRLLASITFDRKQYYMYDEAGRLIAHLDSVRSTDGKFTVKEYSFSYDDNSGKLNRAITPEGTVNFNFDTRKNILTQAHFAGDTMKLSRYYYDALNRVVLIEGLDQQNKIINKVERAFSSNGTLHREEIVGRYSAGLDSTVIMYVYNANRQLQQKLVYSFRKFYVSMSGSVEPTHSAEQFSLGTLKYTYDKKGNKIAEEYTNSIDKLSNYYNTWQYNDKGLLTKRTQKQGIFEPQVVVYDYGFFEK